MKNILILLLFSFIPLSALDLPVINREMEVIYSFNIGSELNQIGYHHTDQGIEPSGPTDIVINNNLIWFWDYHNSKIKSFDLDSFQIKNESLCFNYSNVPQLLELHNEKILSINKNNRLEIIDLFENIQRFQFNNNENLLESVMKSNQLNYFITNNYIIIESKSGTIGLLNYSKQDNEIIIEENIDNIENPAESCHLFRFKVAGHSGRKLPPIPV
ncbi:hypothetical protein [Spirochaeta isovalerica]|uniref:Uncharacterized protein n=1 Tax=Spirochaeta isovalerica TaxID=150 RepID=A0A841RJP7_9SPIO|nr:hypothetical protein [Spirochaeta isovalerica]MBB6482718.1 hypothetical protein [Spirochaeta isovalerica]